MSTLTFLLTKSVFLLAYWILARSLIIAAHKNVHALVFQYKHEKSLIKTVSMFLDTHIHIRSLNSSLIDSGSCNKACIRLAQRRP